MFLMFLSSFIVVIARRVVDPWFPGRRVRLVSWRKGISRLWSSLYLRSFFLPGYVHFWLMMRMCFNFSDLLDLLLFFQSIAIAVNLCFDFRTFHSTHNSEKKWWNFKGQHVNTVKSLLCHFSEKWDGKSVHCHRPLSRKQIIVSSETDWTWTLSS